MSFLLRFARSHPEAYLSLVSQTVVAVEVVAMLTPIVAMGVQWLTALCPTSPFHALTEYFKLLFLCSCSLHARLPLWWTVGIFRLLASSSSWLPASAWMWAYGVCAAGSGSGAGGGSCSGSGSGVDSGYVYGSSSSCSLSEAMAGWDQVFQQSCAQLRDNHCVVHTGWR